MVTLLVAGGGAAIGVTETVLEPIADTTIPLDADYQGPSLGGEDTLAIGWLFEHCPEYDRAAYLKFDVSSVPDNAEILSVSFSAYEYDGHWTQWMPFGRAVGVCPTTDWDEMGMNYQNRPTDITPAGALSYDGAMDPYWGCNLGTLADDSGVLWSTVREAVAAEDGLLTLVLSAESPAACQDALFRSREAGSDRPALTVTWQYPYAVDAGPDQQVLAESADGASTLLTGAADPWPYGLTFTWSVDGNTIAVGWQAAALFAVGEHEVTLTVEDAEGRWASDTMHVTVYLPDPLWVDAGPDMALEGRSPEGRPVGLIGNAGPWMYVRDYSWTVNGGVYDGRVVQVVLPLGTHTATLTATDIFDRAVSDAAEISIVDTTPPTIVSIVATPGELTPPDGKMHSVVIEVEAVDICDPAPVSLITNVTCNEQIKGKKAAWVITGDLTVDLQAKCSSRSVPRVYTIEIVCVDASGNETTGTVEVTVPPGEKGGGKGKDKKK